MYRVRNKFSDTIVMPFVDKWLIWLKSLLSTKVTFISDPHILKISLRSNKHGLRYSLKSTWRYSSKFTHYHCFLLRREKAILKKWEVFSSNNLIIFGRGQLSIWKMSLNKKNFLGAINFNTGIQKHWNQIKWIHNQCVKVCIFWIWPLIALEAVAEDILASSQWNF